MIEDISAQIAATLADRGSGTIFGVPGGGNNLEMIGAAESHGVRFVLAHTETAATIMAGVDAELSGRVSASIVTRGPGAASAVNGVAQAMLDRQPLLMLSDTVSQADSDRVSHQLLDQRQMFGAVSKWSTVIGSAEPAHTIAAALDVATSGRPGPVHLDIDPTSDLGSPPPPVAAGPRGELTRALEVVATARRPVVLVGIGGRSHGEQIRRIVAGSGTPVMMTYKAVGALPDSDPHVAGLFTGALSDAMVLHEADVIVCIGLDTVELIPNPWNLDATIISLAQWPETHPYFEPDLEVVGDLATLLPEIPEITADWGANVVAAHRARISEVLMSGAAPDLGVAPWDIVSVTRAAADAGSIATVDAGAHMLAAMPLWKTERPGELLISSGLATMGFALPAAIAAAIRQPDRRTYCFVGDGGLGMALAELETVIRLALPITIVVFNDSRLTLIELKQKPRGHGGAGAVSYRPTDFAMIAAAVGIASRRIEDLPELTRAVSHSSSTQGPELLDVLVDSSAYRHVIDVVRHGTNGSAVGPRQTVVPSWSAGR
ncbi:MAG: thiamine pyrophosphate-binding protein [Pseudonocardiaceae bacterium]